MTQRERERERERVGLNIGAPRLCPVDFTDCIPESIFLSKMHLEGARMCDSRNLSDINLHYGVISSISSFLVSPVERFNDPRATKLLFVRVRTAKAFSPSSFVLVALKVASWPYPSFSIEITGAVDRLN